MYLVVNRVALSRPIEDRVMQAAAQELPARAAAVPGLRALHVARAGDQELIVVLVGDDEQAIESMRAAVGDEWMREHVIPHAAGRPQRSGATADVSWTRG